MNTSNYPPAHELIDILEKNRSLITTNNIAAIREALSLYSSSIRHSDDDAVDEFALKMKLKLAKKRTQGYSGWNKCTQEYLSNMLHELVEKGDPLDVAIVAMMLYHNNQTIQKSDHQEHNTMNDECDETGWWSDWW